MKKKTIPRKKSKPVAAAVKPIVRRNLPALLKPPKAKVVAPAPPVVAVPKYTREGILKNPQATDKFSPDGVMKSRG